MKNIQAIRSLTVNKDLRKLCDYLRPFPAGTEIDEAEAARALGLDRDTVGFLLDALVEAGAILFDPPPFDGGLARAA